jgi:predicted metal-dependent hydrolase
MIPPGERFFIRAVRHFEDRVTDPELKGLVKGFIQQEGLHMRAHNEFNQSLAQFGIDVEREIAAAERTMSKLQKRLPRKMQLGVTVFLEHVTAIGAHMLFMEPLIAESMHPELARFWRWHAAEELEHKAVAFDVFRAVGGGYLLRVFSALTAVLLLTPPLIRRVRRMEKQDPREVTKEMRRSARELNQRLWRPQLRMLAQYFKPGFHPWNCDDEPYLRQWYASADGA